jgi:hypothetical protein
MIAKYASWRGPTGRPSDQVKCVPTAFLRECGPKLTVNKEGGVSWQLEPVIDQLLMVLRGAIFIRDPKHQELNEHDAWGLIRKGLINTVKNQGGKQPIDPEELLTEINSHAGQFFQLPETDYVMVGSLSVAKFPVKSIRFNGCEIRPLRSRMRYPYPDAHALRPGTNLRKRLDASKYQLVAVKTRGRTFSDATNRAMRSLDVLRGVWTLAVVSGRNLLASGPQTTPVGVVHHGPVHTLHGSNGKPVEEVFWRDSASNDDWNLFSLDEGWAKVEKIRKWAFRRLGKSKMGDDIQELLARYAVALDQTDFEIAFLHLWAVLEKLTQTIGGSYDETIRRACWWFADKALVKEILECGRLRRNRYVHSSQTAANTDELVHVIKGILDPLLISLIRDDLRISSLEDVGRFLSLPTDLAQLRKDRGRYNKAIGILVRRVDREGDSSPPGKSES